MLTLETRLEKIKIRQHILGQFFEFIKLHDSVIVNSLPASSWKWEDNIVNHVNMVHPDKKVELNCADRDSRLHQYFPYPIESNDESCGWNRRVYSSQVGNVAVNAGFGFDFHYWQNEDSKSFSWADYCGNPSRKLLRDFADAIYEDDVIYVTFSRAWRCNENVTKAMLKLKDKTSAGEATVAEMENIIRKKVGNNFTRIYLCSYIGGRQTPMLTVGWHFVANSPIKSLNFEWQTSKTPITKAAHVEPVQALVKAGVADAEIFKQFPSLTTMQLAGAKAAIKRALNKTKIS